MFLSLCVLHTQALVIDNDLFIYNVASKNMVQVTADGEDPTLFNGVPDWLYEGMALSCPCSACDMLMTTHRTPQPNTHHRTLSHAIH